MSMETIFGDTEREFPAGPDTEVDVHILAGKLVVESGSEGTVRVHAIGDDEGSDIAFQREGNRLIFRHPPLHGSHDVDLHLTVPTTCTVKAETVHADMEVSGTRGALHLHSIHGDIIVSQVGSDASPVSVESVEGDINASQITGELTLISVNGDVQVSEAYGVLTGQTANGDFHVERSQLRRFHLNTMNGDTLIETPLSPGEHYYCQSANGDIHLTVPSESAFVLQMKTVNGEVHCTLPHEMVNGSRRNRQVRVNGGGATVELETTNGEIHVNSMGSGQQRYRHMHHDASDRGRAHSVPPIPPTPPTPPSPSMTVPASPVVPPTPVVPPIPPVPPSPIVPNDGEVIDLTHLSNLDDLGAFETEEGGLEESSAPGESTIEVLAKLEAGELTVDQAMERLEALH